MRMTLQILFLFITGSLFGQSQQAERAIQSGNDLYKQEQFNKAATEYNRALEADPSNTIAKFNQANAFYRQDQKVEAAQIYSAVISGTGEKGLRSKAYYNKGVVLSAQKNLEESIEAYKNTLRLNPDDKDARENLQKALLELKKKQPPPKKENQQKKKQDQQKQQQQPKMSPKDAEQRLQLLQQKEKEVQQRIQKEKNKNAGSLPKDW